MLKSLLISTVLISCMSLTNAPLNNKEGNLPQQPAAKSIYDFSVESLDGKKINFASFKGKKILIVNTASECGYTPQYEGLEALYKKYKDRLVIVGFPANNFGGQEPGTNAEIKEFCTGTFHVTFPMAAKISVKGDDMHPL